MVDVAGVGITCINCVKFLIFGDALHVKKGSNLMFTICRTKPSAKIEGNTNYKPKTVSGMGMAPLAVPSYK